MMFEILGNGRENFTDNVRVAYVVKPISKRYHSFVSSKVFRREISYFFT